MNDTVLSKSAADSIVANALASSTTHQAACSTSLAEPANEPHRLADSVQQSRQPQPAEVVAAIRCLSLADSQPPLSTGAADVTDGTVSTNADSAASVTSNGLSATVASPPSSPRMHDSPPPPLSSTGHHQVLSSDSVTEQPAGSAASSTHSHDHQQSLVDSVAATAQADYSIATPADISSSLANPAPCDLSKSVPAPISLPTSGSASPIVTRLANASVIHDMKPVALQRCTSWSASVDPRDKLLLLSDLNERRRTTDSIPSHIIDQLAECDAPGLPRASNALSEELAHIFRKRASICAHQLTDCDLCFGAAGSGLTHNDSSRCESPVSACSSYSPGATESMPALPAHLQAVSNPLLPRMPLNNGNQSVCPIEAATPSNSSTQIVKIARLLRQVNTKEPHAQALVQVAYHPLPFLTHSLLVHYPPLTVH